MKTEGFASLVVGWAEISGVYLPGDARERGGAGTRSCPQRGRLMGGRTELPWGGSPSAGGAAGRRDARGSCFSCPVRGLAERRESGGALHEQKLRKQLLPLEGPARLYLLGEELWAAGSSACWSGARLQGLKQPVELAKSFILHLISCSDQYGFLEQFGGL